MALAAAPELPGFRAPTPLGYGPTSTIYSAESVTLGRWVAVTVYSTHLADERGQRRFRRGYEMARRLGTHPHAVTVLDHGFTPDGRPYVASEIYEQGTLEGRVQARQSSSVSEVLHIGIALSGALETAHRAEVIHGGVHPARVLLAADGQPAVADLGLVPLVDRSGLAALIGPMAYHSPPEVLEGEALSPASDVYSLASTLYTALAERAPYAHPGGVDDDTTASLLLRILQHEVPAVGRADVPPRLEQLLRQALSCEPRDRPDRPLAFAQALQACQNELSLAVTQPVMLDVAAALTVAVESPLNGTPLADVVPSVGTSNGAAANGAAPAAPERPPPSSSTVQREFVPYPLPEPATEPPALPSAPLAPSVVPAAPPAAPTGRRAEPAAPSAWPAPGEQPPMAASPLPSLDPPVRPSPRRALDLREPADDDPVLRPVVELRHDSGNDAPDSPDRLRAGSTQVVSQSNRTRALPVIVLGLLVAVIFAGVTWSIVTGESNENERARPQDADDPTGQPSTRSSNGRSGLTAVENSTGVQLDWDGSSGDPHVVVVLSTLGPPQILPADTGTALLIPTADLDPAAGFCFAVVPAPEPLPSPADLAATVSGDALGPDQCVRSGTATTVLRR